MKLVVVALSLTTVAWLLLGFVPGMVTWAWLAAGLVWVVLLGALVRIATRGGQMRQTQLFQERRALHRLAMWKTAGGWTQGQAQKGRR